MDIVGRAMDRRRFLSVCCGAGVGLGALGCSGWLTACGGAAGDQADGGSATPAGSPHPSGPSPSTSVGGSPAPTGTAYYTANMKQYMAMTEGMAHGLEKMMAPDYGAHDATAIAAAMVADFKEIVPELPYIGGDENPMSQILVSCAMSMAYCLAMGEHGKPMDEAGRYNYFVYAAFQKQQAPPQGAPKQPDTAAARRGARQWCTWTQQRAYPGNWVAEYVGGLQEPYTYGYDFAECGALILARHLGVPGFARYLCILDKPQYEAMGQGMTRTETLADGFDRCNFRFRDDGVVRLEEPFSARKLKAWGVGQS